MPVKLGLEIPDTTYRGLLRIIERQESDLPYVVNEAIENYPLAKDYIENDRINDERKIWEGLWR